jgi:hypothetical protein
MIREFGGGDKGALTLKQTEQQNLQARGDMDRQKERKQYARRAQHSIIRPQK